MVAENGSDVAGRKNLVNLPQSHTEHDFSTIITVGRLMHKVCMTRSTDCSDLSMQPCWLVHNPSLDWWITDIRYLSRRIHTTIMEGYCLLTFEYWRSNFRALSQRSDGISQGSLIERLERHRVSVKFIRRVNDWPRTFFCLLVVFMSWNLLIFPSKNLQFPRTMRSH